MNRSETETAVAPKVDKGLKTLSPCKEENQTGSNSGKLHVSLAGPNLEHMDDEFLAKAYPKEKPKVIEQSDSPIPDPSHQTVTSTPPVISPFTDVSSIKPSSLLRRARLEQEMSEVMRLITSADVLAFQIKNPKFLRFVDKYLGRLRKRLFPILETKTNSSSAKDKSPSHPSPLTLMVGEMHKEAQQAAGGLTSLGSTSEEVAHPQLSSGIIEESIADDISKKIKLEDLSEFLKDTRSAFFTPDSPQDDPIIITDESKEEEVDKEDTYDTSHDVPKDTYKDELEQQKAIEAEVASLNSLTDLLVTFLKPELSKLLASHNFASCLPTKLKELPSKFTELSREIKELKQHVKDMEIELPGDLKEILTKLKTYTSTISSLSSQVAELKTIQWELPSEFATVVETTLGATTVDVPSAGQATTSPAEGEKNTKDAETNPKDELVDLLGTNIVTRYYNKKLLFDKYYDKMLKRKKSPKITNCEVLTKKGPITLKIYREDGSEEVISNLKTRLDQLTQTELELKIDLNKPLKEQDPLNELNKLANKKRKRTSDLKDHSRGGIVGSVPEPSEHMKKDSWNEFVQLLGQFQGLNIVLFVNRKLKRVLSLLEVDIEQVAVSSSLRLLEPKRTIESRAKRSSINLVRTQHPSETMVFHNEDGNPARANIKQALGSYERPHKGVKASANSDIMYFFTSAQDGDPLQDDVRLCLGDDLKKAQDHRVTSLRGRLLDIRKRLGHPVFQGTNNMPWRHPSSAIDDLKPPDGSYSREDISRLSAHIVKLRDMPEGVLVLSGLSRVWKSGTRDSIFKDSNGNGMGGGLVSTISFACLSGPDLKFKRSLITILCLLYRGSLSTAPLTAIDAAILDPTPEDLSAGTPSMKVMAKVKASKRQKAYTFDDDDDDDDACVEIPLITPIRSTATIHTRGNQRRSYTPSAAEGPSTQDSRGKVIMSDVADASSRGADHSRTSADSVVVGSYEVSREELDGPHQPTLTILSKDIFKDPRFCKTMVDQFPTLGEMVRIEALTDDQLATKMSVLHFSGFKKQVAELNDKLSSFDAAFVKSKAKVLEAERDAEILLLRASPSEFASLFQSGLQKEFDVVLKKISRFIPGAYDRLVEASPFLKVGSFENCPPLKTVHVSPPLTKESIVTPVSSSLEFVSNVIPSSSAVVIFVHGVAHLVNEIVVQTKSSLARGLELASSGPNDVVVALSARETKNVTLLPQVNLLLLWPRILSHAPALSRTTSLWDCSMAGQASVGSTGLVLLSSRNCIVMSGLELACFPAVAIFATFLASPRLLSAASTEGLVFMPTGTSWLRNSNLMDASSVSDSAFEFKALGRCVI
ncbi:hypothetical protein Tco_0729930 [Tanacetum coccineum]|uniref:Uncharacterized protein n=1 Tax=Tanacetum coccineum TaxID=301880 RepID=A0ABQ4YQB1_9ASTR